MQLNPKKIVGALGRKYGGRQFEKMRKKYYNTLRICQDYIGTLFVFFHKNAPFSLDAEIDRKLYHSSAEPVIKAGVVVMLDGAIFHGGLTDRIRGILTAYNECKRRNIPFYIYWVEPFSLSDYLLPATLDWRITKEDITRSRKNARAVAIDDMNDRQSLRRIKAALFSRPPQLHLYTNADSARGKYHTLFNELFRPAPELLSQIKRHKEILGEDYWVFTTRFLTLLGDFTDWCDETLNEADQTALMNKVVEEFKSIAKNIPEGKRILVTSDSMKFLNFIKKRDSRVYIVEGEVVHIDLTQKRNEDSWMKTFVDQFLIMGATTVVRLRTGGMYASGFARFGAEVGEAKFIDHKF